MVVENIHQAKTQLSGPLVQVEAGDEVVIARNGTPIAGLERLRVRDKRRFGALRRRIEVDEDFLDPLPETELAAWER